MMTNFEFPTINYDVVIVGGGISGLTLACGGDAAHCCHPVGGQSIVLEEEVNATIQ